MYETLSGGIWYPTVFVKEVKMETDGDINNSNKEDNKCTDLVVFSYSSPFNDTLRLNERFFSLFNKNIRMLQKWKSGGIHRD